MGILCIFWGPFRGTFLGAEGKRVGLRRPARSGPGGPEASTEKHQVQKQVVPSLGS